MYVPFGIQVPSERPKEEVAARVIATTYAVSCVHLGPVVIGFWVLTAFRCEQAQRFLHEAV